MYLTKMQLGDFLASDFAGGIVGFFKTIIFILIFSWSSSDVEKIFTLIFL